MTVEIASHRITSSFPGALVSDCVERLISVVMGLKDGTISRVSMKPLPFLSGNIQYAAFEVILVYYCGQLATAAFSPQNCIGRAQFGIAALGIGVAACMGVNRYIILELARVCKSNSVLRSLMSAVKASRSCACARGGAVP